MSSSGLIYAVIVGAWAAYLVPMWLRRQDELNEARPTERFSTAIRLLSGRTGMERRYARELAERDAGAAEDPAGPAAPDAGAADPDAVTDSVDVRAFAMPTTATLPAGGTGEPSGPAAGPAASRAGADERPADEQRGDEQRGDGRHGRESAPRERPAGERPGPPRGPESRAGVRSAPSASERARRSKVLARRRRTTMALFLAFTAGAVVAAVGGLAFLWAPAAPAVLLSAYIGHLRVQERRRFAWSMDQRRAEAAARHLRERARRSGPPPEPSAGTGRETGRSGDSADPRAEPDGDHRSGGPGRNPASPHTAGRRALVEQTDHAEWVDQQRDRGGSDAESWDPVPVPLPTYVTAPVAPRFTDNVDLDAPDAWSSARSGTAGPPRASGPASDDEEEPGRGAVRPTPGRRARERGRTPLFDQYAHPPRTDRGPGSADRGREPGAPPGEGLDRPRAANE